MLSRLRIISFGAMTMLATGCQLAEKYAGPSEYQDRATQFAIQADTLRDMEGTAWKTVPTSGSASFVGGGRIIINPNPNTISDDIRIVGDLSIVADFEQATMTGAISNMQGVGELSVNDATPFDVEGSVVLGAGHSVVGTDTAGTLTTRPNEWYVDYAGSLGILGETYVLDGGIDCGFVGTRGHASSDAQAIHVVIGNTAHGETVTNGQGNQLPIFIKIFGVNPYLR